MACVVTIEERQAHHLHEDSIDRPECCAHYSANHRSAGDVDHETRSVPSSSGASLNAEESSRTTERPLSLDRLRLHSHGHESDYESESGFPLDKA